MIINNNDDDNSALEIILFLFHDKMILILIDIFLRMHFVLLLT